MTASAKFPPALRALQQEVNQALANYFASLPKRGQTTQSQLALKLIEEFSMRPAKRIRGSLTMIAYKMFGGKNQPAARNMAGVVELIQNYLLIIDDVMDRSKLRRGGPTIHEQYLAKLGGQDLPLADRKHLANMLAVNVALITQHMAFELLATIKESPERLTRVQGLFQHNILATGYGQIEDLYNSFSRQSSPATIKQVYILKSSYYTFINPLQVGAALAGAKTADLAALRRFGTHAGLAFQLRDDLIGMFGSQQQTGKSSLDDLREGKLTMLVEHALTHGNKTQAATIRAALGNPKLSPRQAEAVKLILADTGSREYVAQQAEAEVKQAQAVLNTQKWDKTVVDLLQALLVYSIEREH